MVVLRGGNGRRRGRREKRLGTDDVRRRGSCTALEAGVAVEVREEGVV